MLCLTAATLALSSFVASAEAHDGAAVLHVDNRLDERVSVFVDDDYLGTLAPRSHGTFEARPGRSDVVVKDARGRVVLETRHVLTPSHEETFVIRPLDGVVRAENRTVEGGTLLVDGVSRGHLAPGADVDLRLPLGEHRFEFLVDGHVVECRTVAIDGYRSSSFVVDAALLGTLVVKNPLPIQVVVDLPGAPARTVQPYGTAVLRDVPAGFTSVQLRRVSGEAIATLRPDVDAFDTTRVEVPVPKQGFVEIRSDDWRTLYVRIDGRMERQFEHDLRLSLSTGVHRIEVRTASGRVVASQSVRVDPFDASLVRVRQPAYADAGASWSFGFEVAGDGRRDHDDRDHHDRDVDDARGHDAYGR